MEDANFEEEYNRLIQDITGISDKELAHEAMKILICSAEFEQGILS